MIFFPDPTFICNPTFIRDKRVVEKPQTTYKSDSVNGRKQLSLLRFSARRNLPSKSFLYLPAFVDFDTRDLCWKKLSNGMHCIIWLLRKGRKKITKEFWWLLKCIWTEIGHSFFRTFTSIGMLDLKLVQFSNFFMSFSVLTESTTAKTKFSYIYIYSGPDLQFHRIRAKNFVISSAQ